MGIPGVLTPFPTISASPSRSPVSVNSALPHSFSSSSTDRKTSSIASSTSFGGSTTLFLKRNLNASCGSCALSKLKNGTRRLSEGAELGLVVCCLAQESGTLSKAAPGEADDSTIRSQGAATIYEDPSIRTEKKVVGEDEGEDRDGQSGRDGAAPRPKRIDFDYGFQAKFLRTGPKVPQNVFKLAFENFGREWRVYHK
jgi:hypothetical protein